MNNNNQTATQAAYDKRKTQAIVFLPFLLITLLSYFCYSPGFSSPFILDDIPNLKALTQIQDSGIFSAGFWEFVTSGTSGPTGRPLALFTMALQADSWPGNPTAFKLVNFFIHTLCSALVYVLCLNIFRLLNLHKNSALLLSLLTTAVWTLHPMQSSTVLYTIQRMALLSNLFMLLGIVIHLYLRKNIDTQRPFALAIAATFSLAFTGTLALLSKENIPSLLLYLLALEYTVLSSTASNKLFKIWRALCLWLPLALLAAISVFYLDSIQAGYSTRIDFNMSERLLTESRILWQYLHTMLVPTISGSGLFQSTSISSSLFAPLSTLFAVIAWIILIVLAVMLRRTQPIFALAIFWFCAGHIVESTFIALELIFLHRNYLALLGPIIALVYYAHRLVTRNNVLEQLPWLKAGKYILSVVIILMLWFQSFSIATLWSKPERLAAFWYVNDPDTSRVSQFYAIQLINSGAAGISAAAEIYDLNISNNPDSFRLVLDRLTLNCLSSNLPVLDDRAVLNSLMQRSLVERNTVTPLLQLVDLVTTGNCPAVSLTLLDNIIDGLHPTFDFEEQGSLEYEKARIRIAQGELTQALELFDSAYAKNQDPGILFIHAIYLINQPNYPLALEKINTAIEQVNLHNDITTGTREVKLARLMSMRNDVLQLQTEPSP